MDEIEQLEGFVSSSGKSKWDQVHNIFHFVVGSKLNYMTSCCG